MANIFFTQRAQVIVSVTGSISGVSSLILMSIIVRSQSKLSSCYHRIMFFTSFWDIIASIAISMTTLPMPSNVHDIYPFEGKACGNAQTCQAQGFLVLTGQAFTICANITLGLYYICTIRFKMSEKTARKWLEPCSLLSSCLIALPTAIVPLFVGLVNPRPYEPYCYFGTYPGSNKQVSVSVERMIAMIYAVCIGIAFVLVISTFVLVVVSIFTSKWTSDVQVQRDLHDTGGPSSSLDGEDDSHCGDFEFASNEVGDDFNGYGNLRVATLTSINTENDSQEDDTELGDDKVDGKISDGNSNVSRLRSMNAISPLRHELSALEFKQTRNALRIALMYIGAFFLTYIWLALAIVAGPFLHGKTARIFWIICDHGKLTFTPLQGFFNALIFLFDKVQILRDSMPNDRSIGFCAAIKTVIISPSIIPEILMSRIELVEEDDQCKERIEAEKHHQDREDTTITPSPVAFSTAIQEDYRSIIAAQCADKKTARKLTFANDEKQSKEGEDNKGISTEKKSDQGVHRWNPGSYSGMPNFSLVTPTGDDQSEESSKVHGEKCLWKKSKSFGDLETMDTKKTTLRKTRKRSSSSSAVSNNWPWQDTDKEVQSQLTKNGTINTCATNIIDSKSTPRLTLRNILRLQGLSEEEIGKELKRNHGDSNLCKPPVLHPCSKEVASKLVDQNRGGEKGGEGQRKSTNSSPNRTYYTDVPPELLVWSGANVSPQKDARPDGSSPLSLPPKTSSNRKKMRNPIRRSRIISDPRYNNALAGLKCMIDDNRSNSLLSDVSVALEPIVENATSKEDDGNISMKYSNEST